MIVACHGGIVGRRIPRVVKTRYISLLPERLRLLMKKWARGRGSRGLFGVVPTAVAAALSILPVTGWTGRDIIKARQICCFVFVTALVTVGNSDRGGDDGGDDDDDDDGDGDDDCGGEICAVGFVVVPRSWVPVWVGAGCPVRCCGRTLLLVFDRANSGKGGRGNNNKHLRNRPPYEMTPR